MDFNLHHQHQHSQPLAMPPLSSPQTKSHFTVADALFHTFLTSSQSTSSLPSLQSFSLSHSQDLKTHMSPEAHMNSFSSHTTWRRREEWNSPEMLVCLAFSSPLWVLLFLLAYFSNSFFWNAFNLSISKSFCFEIYVPVSEG